MVNPNFFIIGAPKSGTTALAHYLASHPNVFISSPKELFYWSEDHPVARTRHNVFQLDQYLEYFRRAEPKRHLVVGEGSTNYLQSRTAVSNILEFNPQSKFIVLLRDPVEVAYGMHGELMRHYFEDEPDFRTAWDLQAARREGNRIPKGSVMVNQLQYEDVVNYAEQMRRFFDLVPASQRRVFLFTQFARDTRSVYAETLRFLGLEDDGRTEFPRVNEARQYRSGLIGKVYQNPPAFLEPVMKRFRVWYSGRSDAWKESVAKMLSRKEPRKKLDPEFEGELRSRLTPMVEQLESVLELDLSSWKAAKASSNQPSQAHCSAAE